MVLTRSLGIQRNRKLYVGEIMGFDLGSAIGGNLGSIVGAGSSLLGGFINASTSKTIDRKSVGRERVC